MLILNFKQLYLLLVILLLFSCSKQKHPQRELDIEIYPKSGEIPVGGETTPSFYPNPFYDQVYLYLDDSVSFTVNIANVEGFKKLELSGEGAMFDFSNESSGAYNAEVLVSGKVYRFTLLKDE